VLPIKHSHLYKIFKKNTGGGILLFGLPGTGKTLFAEAVSNEIDAKFFSIKCSDIKSKWIGESEKKIKDLFKNARKEKRAVIFFDEFESIGKKRSSDDLSSEATVPEILAQMQGVGTDNNNILVIAATNRPWDIDSALLRPGRFDEKIYVPLPDYLARKEIFKIKLKDLPHEDIDFDYLASITNNCNGADISYFCERLKMSVINRSIQRKQQQKMSKIDIDKVKENFKSSVNLDDLEEMEIYHKKWTSI
ncbi:MAG: ATP-binding protein, partial [Malacoplasma sp.]|nr:ATP-binding protein [Malacoplasma sp.]